ncbi:hypothetical protein SEA_DATBOI_151 [Gordonia phage DatBoi]|nr:hypothetical protein SEA_DATBOI_151 [Gordonia phage DatBoi]
MHDDVYVTTVTGTITTSDGRTREFTITEDGGWSQWGADRETLGDSVIAIEEMAAALLEAGELRSPGEED